MLVEKIGDAAIGNELRISSLCHNACDFVVLLSYGVASWNSHSLEIAVGGGSGGRRFLFWLFGPISAVSWGPATDQGCRGGMSDHPSVASPAEGLTWPAM